MPAVEGLTAPWRFINKLMLLMVNSSIFAAVFRPDSGVHAFSWLEEC
jgi:hypothetical protein